jgi:FkbM family methyltransferase
MREFNGFATREDIIACFRLLLGRYPSEAEWNGHSALAGTPLNELVSAYLNSLEFRQRGLINANSRIELVTLDRFRMYVATDDALIGNAIRTTRVYEPRVSQLFIERLHPGACVLDIGANIGYFSLLASSLVGSKGDVLAFEPLATNVRLLTANKIVNEFHNIKIFAGAASDGIGTFSIGASYSDGIIGAIPQSAVAALASEFVLAIPVDAVVEKTVDLIKIDVEGHEFRVVTGAMQTIRRSRPMIVSEFSPAALEANSCVSPRRYLDLLRSLGYRISAIGQPGINTNAALLDLARNIHHIDILAEPEGTHEPRTRSSLA